MSVKELIEKYREQIAYNAKISCGFIVGDGCENRKDERIIKVNKSFTNGNTDPEEWMYCVSWYDVDEKGNKTITGCENGVTLEQAARAMAIFKLCGINT